MSYRFQADERFPWSRVQLRVAFKRGDRVYSFQPVDLQEIEVDPGVEIDAFMEISHDAARALYEALGAYLGAHGPDTRIAAEALAKEQARVDQFINYLTEIR